MAGGPHFSSATSGNDRLELPSPRFSPYNTQLPSTSLHNSVLFHNLSSSFKSSGLFQQPQVKFGVGASTGTAVGGQDLWIALFPSLPQEPPHRSCHSRWSSPALQRGITVDVVLRSFLINGDHQPIRKDTNIYFP